MERSFVVNANIDPELCEIEQFRKCVRRVETEIVGGDDSPDAFEVDQLLFE